ncbi:hypothetical protein SAMN05421823_102265 [Catalinimonas alkaloidigena]|uniref:Apea-like HEPN domain-containing protein n=1 Tax=Catalinimonas alkaloidigena TaxID=1075417 RepID=A0A1G9ADP4_9BACT|nr:hypothetical protein [Catalinimonas alkaloidigena]SDK25512.1 hypothetical protein SAMN05421823_102265 [Catalinimonas alkaloidigena]
MYKIANSDWKFIALIEANVIFEDDYFKYKESLIRVLRDQTEFPKELHLLEVYTKRQTEEDIDTAYYRSIDLLSEFIDQLSFITFQPANIYSPLAISYAKTKIGGEFPMLHIHSSFFRKRVGLQKDDFIDFTALDTEKSKYYNLLRLLKYYQNTPKLDDKFLYLYSVLDFVANLESKEFQTTICPSCNFEISLPHKATGKYIKSLASEYDIKNFNMNKVRGLRSKIAHGASKRDYSFFKDLAEYLPILEELAYKTVRDKVGISMKLITNIHGYTPLLKLESKCEETSQLDKERYPEHKDKDHKFQVINFKTHQVARFTTIDIRGNKGELQRVASKMDSEYNFLPDNKDPDEYLDGSIGVDFDNEGRLPISQYAWPYCIK